MELSDIAVDVDREQNGDWVPLTGRLRGVRVKVRSMFSDAYRNVSQDETRRLSKIYRDQPVPLDQQDASLIRRVVEGLLLDWDGITENGQPYPFTRENAYAALQDKRYRPLLDGIVWAGGVVGELGRELDEDEEKNSSRSSNGTSSTENT